MKTKGGGPHNFKGGAVRKAHKEASIAVNNESAKAWAQLTPQQQLRELDLRLGQGVGAVKQRARIARALAS